MVRNGEGQGVTGGDVGARGALAPTGTVTFLLTDVEGSTKAWESDPAAMREAMARHDDILAQVIDAHGGHRPVEQGEGDSVVAAFARASDAVAAALAAQLALADTGMRVRMAINTGEAEVGGGRYAGPAIIRAARLRAAAHGGQTLVSRSARELVADTLPAGAALVPLGAQRLRDLGVEDVFQLSHADLPSAFPPLRTLEATPTNVPAALSRFIGRDTERNDVTKLVVDERLLTLTGAGGSGKTRLAREVAADVLTEFADGVWWVELAGVSDPALVPGAVAGALGVRDEPGASTVDSVTDRLGRDRALVVIDNCEHVIGAAAVLVDHLLRRCPRLSVLATSREALGVAGEARWHVPPLATADARRLFEDRAARAQPGFAVTSATASDVAEICARVDNLPLAVELAAARVAMLTPAEIARALEKHFSILETRAPTAVPRHQTLQASIDWSVGLLDDAERTVMRRASVFAGGWTVRLAEFVCGTDSVRPHDVLDGLGRLVDKSLVHVDAEAQPTRFRFLETVREHALRLLAASGEQAAVADRHLEAMLRSVPPTAMEYFAGDAEGAVAGVRHEGGNIAAALGWAAESGRFVDGLELAARLHPYWYATGSLHAGLRWLDVFADAAVDAPSEVHFYAATTRAHLTMLTGDIAGAVATLDETNALAESLGPAEIAYTHALSGMLWVLFDQRRCFEHSLRAAQVAGDAGLPHLAAAAASHAGSAALQLGDLDRALSLCAPLARGDAGAEAGWGKGCACIVLGALRGLSRGDREGLDLTREGIATARRLGEGHWEAAGRASLADLLRRQGDLDAAAAELAALADEDRLTALPIMHVLLPAQRSRILRDRGELEAARVLATEAVTHARELGFSLLLAMALTDLVAVLVRCDDGNAAPVLSEARSVIDASGSRLYEAEVLVAMARMSGDDGIAEKVALIAREVSQNGTVAAALEEIGIRAAAEAQWPEAARLLAAAAAARIEYRFPLPPVDVNRVDAALEKCRDAGDEAFDGAYAEGLTLSLDEALAYATRARGERKRPPTGWASLTPTETDVVRLVAEGLTNPEIGDRLFMARSTVKTHLKHVFEKLGVSTRTELAAEAVKRQR